ncbi:MAG TPA: hypothetical protein VGE26_03025 [Sphingobacteriaceae bacterium]
MKRITAAALMMGSAMSVSADERPGIKYIQPAQYVLIAASVADKASTVAFSNPQAIVEEGLKETAFAVGYPDMDFGSPDDPMFDGVKEERVKFKDPQAIVEEGLKEAAFTLGYPEMNWGSPDDIRTDNLVKSKGAFRFADPEAITENGLTEKAFEAGYPGFVWGSPSDIDEHEIELLLRRN